MNDDVKRILTIAIPTYNRIDFLQENLKRLERIIVELGVEEQIGILVSDNASTDGTRELLENNPHFEVRVAYHRNEKNIGPIKNTANLFGVVQTKYLMLLGDDDYISKEYLKRVLECLREDAGCIIPSYVNIDLEGNKNGRGRDLGIPSSVYEPGFENCLENAWRGHQLSGLVLRTEGIIDEIQKKEIYNYYLQIYAVAYCCLHGRTYHITEYPILVTRPPQNKKAWGYGEDGLIGEVFSNFVKLDITEQQKYKLQIKFLKDQYWRYAMYIKKGIPAFFKCIGNIVKSPNTVQKTKMVFSLSFGFILVGKAVGLLFSGKLWKTLATKVDI